MATADRIAPTLVHPLKSHRLQGFGVSALIPPRSADSIVRPAMRRHSILVCGALLLTGCFPNFFSPEARCSGVPEFGERFLVLPDVVLPGVLPGFTRQEVHEVYQALRDAPRTSRLSLFLGKLRLDDTQPDLLYFWAGECPLIRYKFKNDLLFAVGAVRMEAGIWHYSNNDYLERRDQMIPTKNGLRRFRIDPKYDEQGNLIRIDTVEQDQQRQ